MCNGPRVAIFTARYVTLTSIPVIFKVVVSLKQRLCWQSCSLAISRHRGLAVASDALTRLRVACLRRDLCRGAYRQFKKHIYRRRDGLVTARDPSNDQRIDITEEHRKLATAMWETDYLMTSASQANPEYIADLTEAAVNMEWKLFSALLDKLGIPITRNTVTQEHIY